MKGYKQEKIWDPVTRLWHWVLVVAISAGWSFGKFMSFDTIQWHFYIGYFVLGLMVFRYLWGFVGPQPIRYRALIPGFSETIQYLRNIGKRKPSGSAGHNPVGSLSVIAMVLIITAQASSGLFVESDDFFESGPMVQYVSEATV
ncbi:MAG: cytochrome b, partial [Gammaproteobacteria bacterium]